MVEVKSVKCKKCKGKNEMVKVLGWGLEYHWKCKACGFQCNDYGY